MENYEFLSSSNDPGGRQFFLVQEDGTFLSRGQGQWMTESIGGGDDGQCTVYDMTQCQFLVDNNESLATTVPADTFMIQSTSSASESYNNDVILQSDDANNVVDTPVEDVDSQNTCTEIILSSEQYDLLQQNGWSLLENGDKVIMLDSSGLHDITNDPDLIQQLKAEIQSKAEQVVQSQIQQKVNSRSILKSNLLANEDTAADISQENLERQEDSEDTVELVFNDDYTEVRTPEVPEDVHFVNDNAVANVADHHADSSPASLPHLTDNFARTANRKVKQVHSVPKLPLKFKTQYYWKDIPEKIYLGRTVNGKNLVAKVKSIINNPTKAPTRTVTEIAPAPLFAKLKQPRKPRKMGMPPKHIAWRNASHLKNITNTKQRGEERMGAEMMFNNAIDGGAVTAEAAGAMAVQLMQTPSLLPMIGDANIVITKIQNCGDTDTCVETSVLTGRMATDGDCPQFIHMPNLLQDIMEKSRTNETNETDEGEFSVLQVHITEIKFSGQDDAISITLHKRSLQAAKPKSLYACPRCPSICKTAEELTQHQEEAHEMDIEDNLTIIDTAEDVKVDNDSVDEAYIVKVDNQSVDEASQIKELVTRHGKLYQCLQCSLQFTRYNNCKNHVKAHKRIQIIIKDD